MIFYLYMISVPYHPKIVVFTMHYQQLDGINFESAEEPTHVKIMIKKITATPALKYEK